jgi:hypothetical protein
VPLLCTLNIKDLLVPPTGEDDDMLWKYRGDCKPLVPLELKLEQKRAAMAKETAAKYSKKGPGAEKAAAAASSSSSSSSSCSKKAASTKKTATRSTKGGRSKKAAEEEEESEGEYTPSGEEEYDE